MRIFLDTNVVIDFCAEREDYFKAAALIFQLGKKGKIELAASATTFINSFYILRKAYPHDELYTRLKGISEMCIITPADANIIGKAFSKVYPDFEDAVQYYSAKELKSDIIITRNKGDFTMADKNDLMTPEEFLDAYYAAVSGEGSDESGNENQ